MTPIQLEKLMIAIIANAYVRQFFDRWALISAPPITHIVPFLEEAISVAQAAIENIEDGKVEDIELLFP